MASLSPPSNTRPIAILQGAESHAIQHLFDTIVARWRPTRRVVGVIERWRDDRRDIRHLNSIVGGDSYRLFQELGSGSTACALDPEGPVLAGEAVRRDIGAGCDLVLISKFGRLEAENGSGLTGAFIAAMEAGVPVLTSVAPRFNTAWAAFAGPLSVTLPADLDAIDAWWTSLRCDAPTG